MPHLMLTLPTAGKSSAPKHDSIMTEDRSEDEDFPMQPPKSVKTTTKVTDSVLMKNGKPMTKKHELFNPIIPSPVKAKVQAFEKHAATSGRGFMSPLRSHFNTKLASGTPNIIGKATTTPLTLTKSNSYKYTSPAYQNSQAVVYKRKRLHQLQNLLIYRKS